MPHVLDHADWPTAEIYDSEEAARAALLENTADYRADFFEGTDDEWLEVCFSEDWTIREAIFVKR